MELLEIQHSEISSFIHLDYLSYIGFLNSDLKYLQAHHSSSDAGYKLDHDAHTNYYDHIPFENNAPVDLHRKYGFNDFHLFKISQLNRVSIDPETKHLLENHDLFQDEYYLENKGSIDGDVERTREFFKLDQFKYQIERYYVKWASELTGFGLFSKQLIKSGEIIGLYGGILTANLENTDYMWMYPQPTINGVRIELGINAYEHGNYLRFVNHAGDQSNTKVSLANARDYLFRIMVYIIDILANEEITIDYGSDYFTTRIDFDE
ncbi:hypothetical protein HDV01_003223 [Terramyces sp. JEL0728]|nr:hypothetical protein HDV01_003220 [Terramyces sp. JEL0728]KAJ3268272.1 hypothetical protein HDV01_003223 [Terramyces sp. JEL0728]